MRDDLQHALASVDWAVSQLPAFQQRTDAWLNENVEVSIKELPPNSTNDVIVATEKARLPLSFTVEVGAYINAIRSSLDILACALAHRFGIPDPDGAHFPVAGDSKSFISGGYKGHEFVQGLPADERIKIEALRPYKGGNDLLWALHRLDIVRKHKRLLAVEINPSRITFMGMFSHKAFTPVSTGWMRSGDDETVLGLWAKGHYCPQLKIASHIAINETGVLSGYPVVAAIYEFAKLSNRVIAAFDQ